MNTVTRTNERRLAVITGAVSGIGASLAELLVSKGWRLVLLNRSAKRTQPLVSKLLTIDADGECNVIETDLSDHASLQAAATQVTEQYGSVDALFNNAGVLRSDMVLSANENEMHFEVNTLAPYLLTRALSTALRNAVEVRGRAVVVTPSTSAIKMVKALDIATLRRGSKGGLTGAYAQTKLAWAVLNEHLAAEYRDDGIELFAVDPGINRTGMTTSNGAPLPVRLIWRLLPKPSAGASRLAAVLDEKWRGRSGTLLLGGKPKPIPSHAATPQLVKELLSIIEEAASCDASSAVDPKNNLT
ncbi:MAG: SDR family NAD(P)-dependent oxidoreductase [Myxococcota bacterium]